MCVRGCVLNVLYLQEAVERTLSEVVVPSVSDIAASDLAGSADQESLDLLLSLNLHTEETLPSPSEINSVNGACTDCGGYISAVC